MIFDHVQIKVAELDKTKLFYDAIMECLELSIVLEIKDVVVGYGRNPHDMFEVSQMASDAPLSKHAHIAFSASSEEMVRRFYNSALAHGAECNGPPGLRKEYEPGYYAAFVIDPNGHNLEAVYSKTVTIEKPA